MLGEHPVEHVTKRAASERIVRNSREHQRRSWRKSWRPGCGGLRESSRWRHGRNRAIGRQVTEDAGGYRATPRSTGAGALSAGGVPVSSMRRSPGWSCIGRTLVTEDGAGSGCFSRRLDIHISLLRNQIARFHSHTSTTVSLIIVALDDHTPDRDDRGPRPTRADDTSSR